MTHLDKENKGSDHQLKKLLNVNHLTSKSDWLLISHYDITLELNVKVMRFIEIVTNFRSSRLSNKFSLSLPLEMWRDQC